MGEKHNVAGPSALIGASNFFELAVAPRPSACSASIPAPLGVLIEVPVMLLVVRVVNSSKGWYQHR